VIPSDVGRQFPDAPGERIAPVTYLFGAKPAEAVEPASEDHASSATHPVFRDESFRDESVAAVREEQPRATGERGNFDRVSNVSMHALARRGMSSREMRDYLVGREFDDEAVQEEIERLEGVGLLDDDSLAETLVRTLRDRKGLGRSALTAELRRRHVDGDAIEEAMGSLEDDELERATAIAVKRAPQLRSLDSVTAKRRLGAFLMRKGYSGSVISTAVQRALAPTGPSFR
jgi:SOS response regulatory protein OraA/RecX